MNYEALRSDPSSYRHKGTVIYASDICGVVFLLAENGRYYVSTNKQLAARIMLVSCSTVITATFEVVELGKTRAAVNVRLDMEEISDEKHETLPLKKERSYNQIRQHRNSPDSPDSLEPIPFNLLIKKEEKPLFDGVIQEMTTLTISSDGASQASESRGTIVNPAPIRTSMVINENDNTLHDTIEDAETEEMKLKAIEKEEKKGQNKKNNGATLDETAETRKNLKVEKVWYEFPDRVEKVLNATDFKSVQKQKRLLNIWWYVPAKRFKLDYPFPCCGICVPIPGTSQIKIFTQRIGCIIRNEDPKRHGLPIAFFFVFGEGDYRTFEYSRLVCTLTSLGPIASHNNCEPTFYFVRGFAVVSISKGAENTWNAWNDYCGWMKCEVGCAREEFKKEKHECQLVRFEAVTQNGDWLIKKLEKVDATCSQQVNYFPAELFFVNDVHPLKTKKQPNGLPVFVSQLLDGNEIIVEREHALLGKEFSVDGGVPLEALVVVTWNGGRREFRALVIGIPELLDYKLFRVMAETLVLKGWEAKRKFSVLDEKPIPTEQ